MPHAEDSPSLGSGRTVLDSIALVLFLAAVLLVFMLMHAQGDAATSRPGFQIFYGGAQMIRHGAAARLYDLGAQAEFHMRFVDHSRTIGTPDWPFISPAATALLFLPLTYLPYTAAYGVWTAVNLVLLVVGIRLLQNELQLPPGDWAVFVAPLFLPVVTCMVQGNISVVLLLMYIVGFVYLRRDRPFLAGCAVGLTALKFQLTAGFIAVLLVRRCWKMLAGAGTGTALLALVSGLTVGWRGLLAYPGYLRRMAADTSVAIPEWMINIRGLLRIATGHDHPVWLLAGISAALIVGAGNAWKDDESGYSIALITAVLTAYYVYLNDATVLLLPLAVAVARVQHNFSKWVASAAIIAVPVVTFGIVDLRLHGCYALLAAALLGFICRSSPQTVDRGYAPGPDLELRPSEN